MDKQKPARPTRSTRATTKAVGDAKIPESDEDLPIVTTTLKKGGAAKNSNLIPKLALKKLDDAGEKESAEPVVASRKARRAAKDAKAAVASLAVADAKESGDDEKPTSAASKHKKLAAAKKDGLDNQTKPKKAAAAATAAVNDANDSGSQDEQPLVAPKPKRRAASKPKKAAVDDMMVASDSDSLEDQPLVAPKAKRRVASKPKKAAVDAMMVASDSDSQEDQPLVAPKPKRRAASKPKKAAADAMMVASDSDSQEDQPLVAPKPKRRAATKKDNLDNQTKPKKAATDAVNVASDSDSQEDQPLVAAKAKKRAAPKKDNLDKQTNPKKAADQEVVPKRVRGKTAAANAKLQKTSDEDIESDEEKEPKVTAQKKGGRKAASKKATVVDQKVPISSNDNAEIDDDKTSKKPQAAKKKGAKSNPAADVPKIKEEEKIKTISWKGKAPVDEECKDLIASCHVFYEDNIIYYAMLNQTDVKNNNNKFYLMELLKDNNKTNYFVWFRWGRVGLRGQTKLHNCGANLEEAKEIFEKKFHEKTKNFWSEKEFFQKFPGKYELLAMDFTASDEPAVKKEKTEKPVKELPKSKLDSRLQSFIELIFSIKGMEATVLEMKYNAKKAPLGKLTLEQVTAGYAALKEIEYCLKNNLIGPELTDACNSFYTKIPHDFGMKRPPLIENTDQLKAKIELLKTLGDIQVAMSILNETVDELNNPIDSHYNSLNCQLKPIKKDSPEFSMVDEYLQNTHAATHQLYKLELVDLFESDRENEDKNYKDVGNRMLLWHGSRLTNTPGILKQGLRIAPPEAPSTGYMFGKGVYFADMSSKSANYCYTSRNQNEGILYLCEVAIGNPNKLLNADYDANQLPAGFHSVMGQGRVMPDPKMTKTLPNGTKVPLGKSVDSGLKMATLNYNEYIVYNVHQIKLKYVLRVKFVYKY